MVRMCAYCKRVYGGCLNYCEPQGITHGICPECAAYLLGDLYEGPVPDVKGDECALFQLLGTALKTMNVPFMVGDDGIWIPASYSKKLAAVVFAENNLIFFCVRLHFDGVCLLASAGQAMVRVGNIGEVLGRWKADA